MNDRTYQIEVQVYPVKATPEGQQPDEFAVYKTTRVLKPDMSIYGLFEKIEFEIDQNITLDETEAELKGVFREMPDAE